MLTRWKIFFAKQSESGGDKTNRTGHLKSDAAVFDNCQMEPCDWWFRFQACRIQGDVKKKLLKDIHSCDAADALNVAERV